VKPPTRQVAKQPRGRHFSLARIASRLGSIVIATLMFGLALGAPPVEANARYASIVIDTDSGAVVSASSPDRQLYPASMTKMMTLYLTFEAIERGHLRLDQQLPVSKRAAGQPPSKLWLRAGQSIRVQDAILALVTKSANDVATVLAESMAKSEFQFAVKMTAKARDLGMKNTKFMNASGLPNRGQKSTARDMATLGRALLSDFPNHFHYFSRKSFTYLGNTYRNHNHLLSKYAGTDGLKTGYINASGFNITSTAVRDGRRLIVVVFGGRTASSRDSHAIDLLNRGFAAASKLRQVLMVRGGALPVPPRKPIHSGNSRAIASQSAAAAALTTRADRSDVAQEIQPGTDLPPMRPQSLAHAATSPFAGDPPMPPHPVEMGSLDGSWGIQLGAFGDPLASDRIIKEAFGRVPALRTSGAQLVSRIGVAGGTLYRAQVGGLDEAVARSACARLEREGTDCMVIQP